MLLHQALAVNNGNEGKKKRLAAAVAGKFKQLTPAGAAQKLGRLSGQAKVYRPLDDEGFIYPPEIKHVQLRAFDVLDVIGKELSDLFSSVATQEYGNLNASADVVVGSETVLSKVPAAYLLFIEKQLAVLMKQLAELPTLDTSEKWKFDEQVDCYASDERETAKMKRVRKNHVRAEATPVHPAQVEVYEEDVPEGRWTTVRYSGALPESIRNDLLERCQDLLDGVKKALMEANTIEIEKQTVGDLIIEYLFAPTKSR